MLPVALVQEVESTTAGTVNKAGSVKLKVCCNKQLLASFTMRVYMPAARLVRVFVFPPPDQLYWYGGVPPEIVVDICPFDSPKQRMGTRLLSASTGAPPGSRVKVWVELQPLASVVEAV